mmetsp:Transcript_40247/g.129319  ORF Transcript_40247/g.129319 Transcript_40247/m.129319 type:complete len:147 (+) Transcript_40247:218-658(+)
MPKESPFCFASPPPDPEPHPPVKLVQAVRTRMRCGRRSNFFRRQVLSSRALLEGRVVLQLGLRARDSLPLAGLTAWWRGGARAVVVHGPWRELDGLAALSDGLQALLGDASPLRVAIGEDFRQLRGPEENPRGVPRAASRSLWLEV